MDDLILKEVHRFYMLSLRYRNLVYSADMLETITNDDPTRKKELQKILLDSFELYDFFRATNTVRNRLTKIAIDYIPLIRKSVLDEDEAISHLGNEAKKYERRSTFPTNVNPFDLEPFELDQYKNKPIKYSIVSENFMILDTFQSIVELLGHEKNLIKSGSKTYDLRTIAYAMHYLNKRSIHIKYFHSKYSHNRLESLKTKFSEFRSETSRKYNKSRKIKHVWDDALEILKNENASDEQIDILKRDYKTYEDNL